MDKYIKVIPYNEAAPYYNVEKVWQANWNEVRWRNIHSKKKDMYKYVCMLIFFCMLILKKKKLKGQ